MISLLALHASKCTHCMERTIVNRLGDYKQQKYALSKAVSHSEIEKVFKEDTKGQGGIGATIVVSPVEHANILSANPETIFTPFPCCVCLCDLSVHRIKPLSSRVCG